MGMGTQLQGPATGSAILRGVIPGLQDFPGLGRPKPGKSKDNPEALATLGILGRGPCPCLATTRRRQSSSHPASTCSWSGGSARVYAFSEEGSDNSGSAFALTTRRRTCCRPGNHTLGLARKPQPLWLMRRLSSSCMLRNASKLGCFFLRVGRLPG